MHVLHPKLEIWKEAERHARSAQRRWLDAATLAGSSDDYARAEELRRAFELKRDAARQLLQEALNDVAAEASRL